MNQVWIIALNTFRESVRSKVLYSVLFFAFAMIAVSTAFGAVTIGDQVKVIKDFGLFSVSAFSVILVVISGASLLSKELAKKTIYNILSKSFHRWQFLAGKYLGMLLTSAVLVTLMGGALLLYLYLFEGAFDLNLIRAFLFNILELVIVCAAAIFFSAIVVTPLLSGLFTLGVFLAGRSIEYMVFFVEKGEISGIGSSILKILNSVLPNLDKLNVAGDVVYGNAAAFGMERFIWSTIYALSYAGVLLVLSSLIFSRRDFN